MTQDITQRVHQVVASVAAAARQAGRDPGEVTPLLAVKTRSDDEILTALDALNDLLPARSPLLLGHNRVQEIAAGGPALAGQTRSAPVPAHQMHLIGPLQSNKINQALRWVDSIDTIAATELADKLHAAVTRHYEDGRWQPDRILEVMVQVNTSGEKSKSGCAPAEAPDLIAHVASLEHLHLRGLMTIGAHTSDEGAVRASFDALAQIRSETLASGVPGTSRATELSMGMSGDLALAIACGATQVRIGTAAFGPRD